MESRATTASTGEATGKDLARTCHDYTGPFRIRKKTLGETGSHNCKNASFLLPSYDGLRRVTEFDWKDLNNEKLIGSDYAYDDVGNPLNEDLD